jgi:ribonuclease HI
MFLWRTCNDILPNRKNLFKRRVSDDDKCPWCNLKEETTAHVIWFCPAAKDVWNAGLSIFHKCAFVEHSFMDIFQLCLGRFSRDEMDYFAAIARRIWRRRNEMLFEGVVDHPNKSYTNAVAMVDDFKCCLRGVEEANQPLVVEVRGPFCWMKPPEGTIKVNFNAAINKNSGLLGLGVIARDCMGYVLGAKRLSKHMFIDAHPAELMAASYAVSFCLEAGFFHVIFEGDALNVIREVNSNPPYSSKDDHFIEGIKQEVLKLNSYSFVHVPKALNEAAYTLAKSAAFNFCDDVWLEEVPLCIVDIVSRE